MTDALALSKTIDVLALVTVVSAGLYLLALALLAFCKPQKAAKFLLGFASSASLHYVELGIRIMIGAGFVLRAPIMPFSAIFSCFGWILVTTSTCLLAVPWHWHQRFAQRAVPQALRYLKLVAISSFALGCFIIACAMYSVGTG